MDARRWQETRALFDELVEYAPGERAERLAVLAATDPELRESLESLLAADTRSSGRLGVPAAHPSVPAPDARAPDPFGLTGRTLSHFRVLEPLGAGGMGVVYRSEDVRLGRPVALKLPLPQQGLDPDARARFLREARAAAALDHPNLCTIYEVGESEDGRLFLAMALYPGETLRARLAREGALPAEDAVAIARQAAQGLACAHAAGVVHRDLKPGNLMLLPDGTVKILDFGLAKARDLGLTGSHTTLGTVAYMAPEQIRGPAVDARADLWALGVVLYEMLTGRRPFEGEHELSLAHAILHQEPVAPGMLRPELSPAVGALVMRLLRKDPEDRFGTADELLSGFAQLQAGRALDSDPGPTPARRGPSTLPGRGVAGLLGRLGRPGPAVLVLFLVVAVLVVGIPLAVAWRSGPAESPPIVVVSTGDPRSLAVLPFVNLSDQRGSDYFVSGLREEVLAQLATLADLRVVDPTPVLAINDPKHPLKQIAAEFGVGAVLQASIQRQETRVRVAVRLIHGQTGEQLWAERYDADVGDVFAIQSDIAQKIASALRVRLSGAEHAAMERRSTTNPAAHDLYLRAREYQGRPDDVRSNLETAERLFERAIALDPEFALAHARLSQVHGTMRWFAYDLSDARLEEQRREAERALRLQPRLAEAHVAMGQYHYWGRRDYESALREFDTALQAAPGSAEPRFWIAAIYRRQGRLEEAAEEWERALALAPHAVGALSSLAVTYRVLRRYPEALRLCDRLLALQPDGFHTASEKGWIYLAWLGQVDTLAAAVERFPPDLSGVRSAALTRFTVARIQRDHAGALRAAEDAPELTSTQSFFVPRALLLGEARQSQGDAAAARTAFEQARRVIADSLRSNPRDERLHLAMGTALAGLGRRAEAIASARRAAALMPRSRDAWTGLGVAQGVAAILAQAGDSDGALAAIERLLQEPSYLSVSLLRVEPQWDPLRSDPRFKRLLEGKAPDGNALRPR
jgi:eukaryotic-like serine/threonine-protein kinase